MSPAGILGCGKPRGLGSMGPPRTQTLVLGARGGEAGPRPSLVCSLGPACCRLPSPHEACGGLAGGLGGLGLRFPSCPRLPFTRFPAALPLA